MQKDPFDLPQIDQVVNSTAICHLLSFLDCYPSYYQIPLKEEDQIKTSFITPFGAFCYTIMPFRVKSASATYQRGIQWCLHTQLGTMRKRMWTMWSSRLGKMRDSNLFPGKYLQQREKFKMKLNPEKCTFGVPLGKLLGYMVSHHGIDPNPEKVSAITKMKPSESLHDV
jgi:hypothetical protein